MTFLDDCRARLAAYPPYYDAPTGDLARFDQNTNLLGPHPATERLGDDGADLNQYPSRDNRPLLDAASRAYGVSPECVWAGNGSDEILDLILRLFVPAGGTVASPQPSYALYPHLCRLNRVAYRPVPSGERFGLPAEALLESGADLLLVANPNNPTGTAYSAREILDLAERFSGPIVVDEAYAEFADESVLRRLEGTPNLIVVRTLSKAHGLAGLRIGFGFAHPDVAELARRAKAPFSVGLLAERIAVRCLADPSYAARTAETIVRERVRLTTELSALGFEVVPSSANFLLAKPPIPRETLVEGLKRAGVLVRAFPHEPRLASFVRFTVGPPAENALLLRALARVIPEATA